MDKALKQRLVGATVLVVLAIILLPMLLSGPSDGTGPVNRSIELPPRPSELDFETRRFPVGDPPVPPTAASEQRPADGTQTAADSRPERGATEVAESPPTDSVSADAGAGDDTSVVDVTPLRTPGTDAVPVNAEPEASAEVAADDLAAETADPPVDDEAVAEASPNDVTATAGGRYAVQVASFANAGNADRLAGRLGGEGFPVLRDTVTSSSGRLYRVRVGPYADETAARQAVVRLTDSMPDLSPGIVDLAPTPDAEPVGSDPAARWVVQAGSFGEEGNAVRLRDRLRGAGFSARVVRVDEGGTSSWKVQIGPEVERVAAERSRDRLADEMGINGLVRSLD